jgi:hypothetical protein
MRGYGSVRPTQAPRAAPYNILNPEVDATNVQEYEEEQDGVVLTEQMMQMEAPVQEISTVWVGDLAPQITDADLFEAFSMFGTVVSTTLTGRTAASGARSAFVRFSSPTEAAEAIAAAEARQIGCMGQPVTCQWAKSDSFRGGVGLGVGPTIQIGAPLGVPLGGVGMCIGGGIGEVATNHFAATKFEPCYEEVPAAVAVEHAQGLEELSTLWIGSLPDGTTENDLLGTLGMCGRVLAITVHSRPSPKGSLSVFVRFATRMEAERALTAVADSLVEIRGAQPVVRWANSNSRISS